MVAKGGCPLCGSRAKKHAEEECDLAQLDLDDLDDRDELDDEEFEEL